MLGKIAVLGTLRFLCILLLMVFLYIQQDRGLRAFLLDTGICNYQLHSSILLLDHRGFVHIRPHPDIPGLDLYCTLPYKDFGWVCWGTVRIYPAHKSFTRAFAFSTICSVREEWRWADTLSPLNAFLIWSAVVVSGALGLVG